MNYHNLLSVYHLEGKWKDRAAFLGILVAMEVIVAFSFLGYITITPVAITTMHIFVIVAAMLMGPLEGGVVGLVFGLTCMWKADVTGYTYNDLIFSPLKSDSPLKSLLLALGPQIMLGVAAGYLFRLLFRYGKEKRRGIWLVVITVISTLLYFVMVDWAIGALFPETGITWENSLETMFSINSLVMWAATLFMMIFVYRLCGKEFAQRFYREHLQFHEKKSVKYMTFRVAFAVLFILMFGGLFLRMASQYEVVFMAEDIVLTDAAYGKIIQLALQFLCALVAVMMILEQGVLSIQDHYTVASRKNKELEYEVEMERRANQAKTTFLSSMSHDIRTPMNAIMGMTAIASMHTDDPERMKDCLNKISTSSQHLLGLINEVLDMSKIESGTVSLSEEEFNLSKLMDDMLTLFQPQIKMKNQDLEINIEDIVHEDVVGDSMRLQQIFVNIMGNAVKFTPEGGTITLRIREKTSDMPENGCYEFVFQDSGIGMDEEFMKHIFEPFSRATDSRTGKIEGTGLGMSIAKNIVQMMHGDIKVKSEQGKGSEFTVTVYLKLCHTEERAEQELAGLNVLVVDDDKSTCENVCQMLDGIGMVPEYALSGDVAISRLLEMRQKSGDYAVIIMDWKMPGKDGVETTREIRERIDDSTPIIILSAYDWSVIEQEAREAGVNGFISKPLFKSRLIYAIKQILMGENRQEKQEEGITLHKAYEGKRVLLVEDNELNIEIAQELLSMTGIQVEKAYDGKQAVDCVLEHMEGYYDLVFMDIQMPNMNGYDAVTAIRNSGRPDLETLPIVAMTADAFLEDVQRTREVGMNDHISKPIETDRLLRCLEMWLK